MSSWICVRNKWQIYKASFCKHLAQRAIIGSTCIIFSKHSIGEKCKAVWVKSRIYLKPSLMVLLTGLGTVQFWRVSSCQDTCQDVKQDLWNLRSGSSVILLNADKGTCDLERDHWGNGAERKCKLDFCLTETSPWQLDFASSCNLREYGGVSPICRNVNLKAVRVDTHFKSQPGSCWRRPVSELLTCCRFRRFCVVNPFSKPTHTHFYPTESFSLQRIIGLHSSVQRLNDGKQTENRSTLIGDVADSIRKNWDQERAINGK